VKLSVGGEGDDGVGIPDVAQEAHALPRQLRAGYPEILARLSVQNPYDEADLEVTR